MALEVKGAQYQSSYLLIHFLSEASGVHPWPKEFFCFLQTKLKLSFKQGRRTAREWRGSGAAKGGSGGRGHRAAL